MINIQIVIHNPYISIIKSLKENQKCIRDFVYDTLTHYNISEETAIDCASFCELACIGDSYNTEDFDVYVNEIN